MSFRWLKLDERRLSQQWIFRLAVAIPFAISFLLCIPLWFETTFDFSSTGYAKFLSMFSLPIGVLSLSIPLVAIVAHIHRTIQTEVQIQESRGKNLSDSFFSHHKYFMEAFSKIPPFSIKINTFPNSKVIDEYKSEIKSPIKLYYSLFKNSSYTNGINNISFLEEINKIKEKIKEINTNLDKEIIELKSIHEIKNIADEIKKTLNIDTECVGKNMLIDQYVMMKKHSERIELLVTNHPRNYSIKYELKIIENFLNELSKILNIDFAIKYNTDSLIKNKTIELSEKYKLAWCYSAWCKNHPNTSYIDIPLLNGTCDLDSDYKIYESS